MLKKIETTFDEIDYVIHISDIHIRLLKRHTEYRHVFRNLYSKLRDFKKNHENSVICLAGDIFHSKTELSPESILLSSEFLSTLADIFPTLVIAGNHDANLANKSRLDSIFPVVKSIDHSNLHYLKKSGEYKIANISFGVLSIFDDIETYPDPSKFSGDIKIALFHGPVHNSITDTGYKLTNRSVTTNLFFGYDLVLLGDIHKKQFLNETKTIAYSSSLIQQNHGESLNNHGILIWNLEKRKSRFIKVENQYGYYTVEVDNGIIPETTDMPERARLRLRTSNMGLADIKKTMAMLRKTHPKITEITLNRINPFSTSRLKNRDNKIDIGDVNDIKYQNDLIVDYLIRNFTSQLNEGELAKIQTVNKDLNEKLPSADVIRNIVWKPNIFKFSNMFSYGENNSIDFSRMKGIIGIFAPNASGKSSILDAFSFCGYDKSSRAWKAINVLNNKRTQFNCELKFDIDGIMYFIKRTAEKNKKGIVKVNVDFYYKDDNKNHSLNGDERRSTNKIIREYIGSYDDFILTALSIQKDEQSIIDMKQSDRKDLLAQFLDVKIFDSLYELANDEIREITILLRQFQKRDFDKELVIVDNQIQRDDKDYKKLKREKGKLETQYKRFNEKIITLTKKLIQVGEVTSDIDTLNVFKTSFDTQRKELINNRNNYVNNMELIGTQLQEMNNVEETYKLYIEVITEKKEIEHEIDKLKIDVQNKLKKLTTLEDLEYDPDCDYCMNNPFVIDARETRQKINEDKISAEELVKKLGGIQSHIDELIYVDKEYKKYTKLTMQFAELDKEFHTSKDEIHELDTKIEKVKVEIKQYHRDKKTIENNKKVQIKINDNQEQLDDITGQISDLNEKILNLYGRLEVLREDKNTILESIEKVKELEEKYSAYQYYLEAVKRDGVPYELISKTIPVVEAEVNNILSQIVDFGIIMGVDGKNINIDIAYDEYNIWPVELASGMERFITSIAIRVALLDISSLPRPNFLAIDEGFGTLDSENINSMYLLFDYLRTQFDFILIISHLDSMRDMVDSIIEVKKVKGYSHINYQ